MDRSHSVGELDKHGLILNLIYVLHPPSYILTYEQMLAVAVGVV